MKNCCKKSPTTRKNHPIRQIEHHTQEITPESRIFEIFPKATHRLRHTGGYSTIRLLIVSKRLIAQSQKAYRRKAGGSANPTNPHATRKTVFLTTSLFRIKNINKNHNNV